MTRLIADKNALIVQGRLLRDKKPAQMTIAQWFELYNKLTEREELKGEQESIVENLAQQLTAVQIASQLKASNLASI